MKEMTRQRKWQMKQVEDGRCPDCGKETDNIFRCDDCKKKRTDYMVEWNRRNRKRNPVKQAIRVGEEAGRTLKALTDEIIRKSKNI